MGKQLYFYHLEEDIVPFLEFLDCQKAKISDNWMICHPVDAAQDIREKMNKSWTRYAIITENDHTFPINGKHTSIRDGLVIEFINCKLWTEGNNLYLDKGRIYLSLGKSGIYTPCALTLYNKISRYFRKNYTYSSDFGAYFSEAFRETFELQKIHPAQNGNPISY